jgi:AcrR family transcriptional regulator
VDVEARRDEFLDAAEHTIRAHGPTVGLGEVAKEAGYARSVLYAVFSSRSAMLAALSKRHAEAILARATAHVAPDADDRTRLAEFIDAICEWVEREPALHRALAPQLLATDDDESGLFNQLAAGAEAVLAANLDARGASPAAAAPWARAMIGSVAAASAWWRRHPTMSRSELVEHLTFMSWEGGERLPLFAARTANSGIDTHRP